MVIATKDGAVPVPPTLAGFTCEECRSTGHQVLRRVPEGDPRAKLGPLVCTSCFTAHAASSAEVACSD